MNLSRNTPPNPFDFLPVVPAMAVKSADVVDGRELPETQRGDGEGTRSPALSWEPGPEGTESYAITCIDPDAPTPGGVCHWVLVDIPPNVTEIPAGVSGVGRTGLNDLGSLAYAGAAPPPGDHPHRYLFTVYALGVETVPTDDATPASLTGFHLTVNALARGSITGMAQSPPA